MQRKARYAGRSNRKGRDEAAAKKESHEGYDKEKSERKKEWTQTIVGGSVSCWTAKKRGSIQGGETPCRDGMIGRTT